jgi:cyanophycinase
MVTRRQTAGKPPGLRLPSMPGPVALIGAGEFLHGMAVLDAHLLTATGRARPRVAIVPTASFPDGEAVFQRWAAMGIEHFSRLGAEVEAVLVRDQADAADRAHAQALGEADLIYFSGGKPGYLLDALEGTIAWAAARAAHDRGAVLAGCAAGAMVLTAHITDLRRRMLPWPLRWRTALGIVDRVTVFPHYDRIPEPVAAIMAFQAPRGTVVLGIDEDTALVGRDGAWQVHGRSRVTIWRGRRRERHRAGAVIRLADQAELEP